MKDLSREEIRERLGAKGTDAPSPTPPPARTSFDATPSSGRGHLTTDEDRNAWDAMTEIQREIAARLGVRPSSFMSTKGDR